MCISQRILKDALNRIAVDEEREQLQGHYSDIQQELAIKTDALKARRQKIRALEREIEDLHSEFQLERADYLESIRKSEQSMRFYQQLLERALPFLRRDNRFWDVDDIRIRSDWNDDTKKWTLPEEALRRVALPPAGDGHYESSYTAPGRMHIHSNNTQSLPPSPNNNNDEEDNRGDTDFLIRKLQNGDNQTIVDSYFRPKRAKELLMRHSNSSNSHTRSRNMLNKMLTETEFYPSAMAPGITGRTILPTNHSNFKAFTAKLKNI